MEAILDRKTISAIFLVAVFIVGVSAVAKPVKATPTDYYVYWEMTWHPRDGGPLYQNNLANWGPFTQDELIMVTGKVLHSVEGYPDYPSYTFEKNFPQVYDKKHGLYLWKGCTMEYFWVWTGTEFIIVTAEDVEAHTEWNVYYHMKDYFLGVTKLGDGDLEWEIYRQYNYWIQTEYSRDTFGFQEDIGDRIHATWDDTTTTYVSSDELWQATSTYWVLPDGTVPTDTGSWCDIYGAFPDVFQGFRYKWLP